MVALPEFEVSMQNYYNADTLLLPLLEKYK